MMAAFSPLLVILFLSLLINLSNSYDDSDAETPCGRHRKAWHTISDSERIQFVTAFQRLRRNGMLSIFATSHHLEGVAFSDIHKTSEFFFWHNYFVWEFETQIRNLGDEYKCFSMPYWDVTNDAIFEDSTSDYLPIFDSYIGIDGNINNNNCVEDDIWNINKYTTQFLCAQDEIYPNCCLKRQRKHRNSNILPTSDDLLSAMKIRRFREFQDTVSDIHGDIHKLFAASNTSHMFANNAAEDPLFVLLHSFVVYIRAMRTSCFNFDQIPNDKIEDYIPFAFDSYITMDQSINNDFKDDPNIKPKLDTQMKFAYIADADWSMAYHTDITPRLMYDISTFHVSYELGTFWENNHLQEWCKQNINETWFYNEDNYDYTTNAQYSNNRINNITFYEKTYSVIITLFYVVIGGSCLVLNIWIVIKQCISYKNKKDETKQNLLEVINYGTV